MNYPLRRKYEQLKTQQGFGNQLAKSTLREACSSPAVLRGALAMVLAQFPLLTLTKDQDDLDCAFDLS